MEAEYKRLGVAMPAFAQAPSDEGDSRPMMLHPQLIVDVKTTIQILDTAFPTNT